MIDSVTNNYSLVQPLVGGDLNIWGGVLNNGTFAAADAALGSNLAVSITSSDVMLTSSQFQNAIFILSGVLTSDQNLIIPLSPNSATVACGGRFVVVNNTTGAYNVTVKTAATASTGVPVPQGFTGFLYSDGTNVGYSQAGLPAYAKAFAGSPNGFLAGTAGSVNTNAELAFDYTNSILYVCTTTGDAADAVWTNIVSGSLPQPALQGYLTPVSNTPIITGDSIAATVIYYTPFLGTWAAIHNGTIIIPYRFSQMQLTLSTSQAANNIYDVYLVYNSGTPVIGAGPSWAAGSGGSIAAGSCARGTGGGGAAVSRSSTTGLWVNTASMSLIYNTGSGNNTITVAAGQGILLGSIFVDASAGQVTCNRSYGQNRKQGVANAYNHWPITLKAGDGIGGKPSLTSSWGAFLSANNSLTTFTCLADEEQSFRSSLSIIANNNGILNAGIGYNSTSVLSGTVTWGPRANAEAEAGSSAFYDALPALGIQLVTLLVNTNLDGTVSGGEQYNCLTAKWRC